jgi:hypothetical protein
MNNLITRTCLVLGLSLFGCANVVAEDEGFGGSFGAGGAGDLVAETSQPLTYTASNWVLQLPTGSGNSPTTISGSKLASGYSSAYYYKASDGGQVFMVPQHGITTSGSVHTRTEMRESTSSGGQAAWSAWGTNSLSATVRVLQISSGSVTIGQTFNGSDSIPLAELMYNKSKGGLILLYEEAKGGGTTIDLKTKIAVGKTFTYKMDLSGGKLKVYVNGTLVYSKTPSSKIQAKKFYFKFGDYDQASSKGTPTTTPYSRVEFYSAVLSHK